MAKEESLASILDPVVDLAKSESAASNLKETDVNQQLAMLVIR